MLPLNWQAEFAESFYLDQPDCEGVSPPIAITLYQELHLHALIQALKNHYPLILKILGQEFFARTAKTYITHYPSNQSSLNDYGAYFSIFLSEYEPVESLVYLPELAEFEWAYHESEYAANHEGLSLPDRERLKNIETKKIYLELHPAVKLIKCYYPLFSIIQWCKNHEQSETHLDVHPEESGVMLLIHRQGNEITLRTLEKADFIFLNRLQEGYSLNEALQQTEMISPLYPIEEKLTAFIDNNIITEISTLSSNQDFS